MSWFFEGEHPYKLLFALGELGLYRLLLHRLDKRHGKGLGEAGLFLLLLTPLCALELKSLSIVPHCLLLLCILALYAWGVHDLALGQCLYFAVLFELLTEVSRLLMLDVIIPAWPLLNITGLRWLLILLLLLPMVLLIRPLLLRDKSRLSLKQLIVILIPYIPYLYIRNLQFSYIDLHGTGEAILGNFYIAPLLCAVSALGMILLNENSILEQLKKNEALEMQALLREQQKQYEIKRVVIDEINRKYHDLKHYARLSAEEGGGEAVLAGDCFQETGNETLNILLPEKSRACAEKGIRLISYIDGSMLGFVEPLDLCVLFGNAVDNAVEAVERLEGEGMKDIRVKIGRAGHMAVMHFHNYFDGQLKSRGGKLASRKQEEGHGYGLRSMQRIAEKYGGTLAYESKDNTFMLTIALPIPGEGAA